MLCLLLLVLAATTAAVRGPCHFTVNDLGAGEKAAFYFDNFNAQFIDLAIPDSPEVHEALASGRLSIEIEAVCILKGDNDFHFFEVSENTLMKVNSTLSSPVYNELSDLELKHIHCGDTRYLRLDIELTNWVKGESTFKIASISETRRHTRGFPYEFDPEQLYEGLHILLDVAMPYSYLMLRSEEIIEPGSVFSCPDNYRCIFNNRATNINYYLRTTGKACLVQYEPDHNLWRTVSVVENSDNGQDPSAEPTAAGTEVGASAENVRIDGNLVFVEYYKDSITHLSWVQNQLRYWMVLFNKALPQGEQSR